MSIKYFLVATSMMVVVAVMPCTGAEVVPVADWYELIQKADSLRKAAKFDSALVYAELSRQIAECEFGPLDTSVARADFIIGKIHYFAGNYSAAETTWKRALYNREAVLGLDHPDVANSLSRIASLYVRYGRFEEAKSLYQRALRIQESAFGRANPDVAQTLNSMAMLEYDQGNYAEAEPLFKNVIEIQGRILGDYHTNVASSLVGLGYVFYNQGRFDDAEPVFLRALSIRQKALGEESPGAAMCLNHLANLYGNQGRCAEAENLYWRALGLFERTLGAEHPNVGWSLTCLAHYLISIGRFDDAEPLYRRASQIQERLLGSGHPDVANCMIGLARVYESQGCHTEAEPLFYRALEIRETTFGANHPDVASSLSGLARNAHALGDLITAHEAESRAWRIREQNFRDGVSVLAERSALEYSRLLETESADYISILLDSPDGQSRNKHEISDVALVSKSLVHDGLLARSRAVETGSDRISMQLTESLRRVRFSLSKLYVDGPGEQDLDMYAAKLESAVHEKERIETELSRRSASYRRAHALGNAKSKSISVALPDRTALVEFLRYEHRLSPRCSESRFLAMIIRRGFEPCIVQLGPAVPIEKAVAWYRDHFDNFASQVPTDYDEISRDLFHMIWAPLDSLVQGYDAIFIAPDGELNLISFAGLQRPDRRYLIEDFAIHYLATGRDLIRLSDEPQTNATGLLAFGDPAFDATYEERCRELNNSATGEPTEIFSGSAPQKLRSGCQEFQERNWNRLAATRDEVMQLATIWSARGVNCTVYTGAQASEERFKSESGGKRIIHLATHGFFVDEECRRKLSGHSHSSESIGENPMLQSGFVLAGANLRNTWPDSTDIEDGIVTAEEVAALELNTTDLVVLSACETGLGNIKAGEGVFGLRRAFQLAGVRTIISTLWQVEDQDAADLASGLLEAGYPLTSSSVRAATLNRLWARRTSGLSDHPYYWAGFIVTGDWK